MVRGCLEKMSEREVNLQRCDTLRKGGLTRNRSMFIDSKSGGSVCHRLVSALEVTIGYAFCGTRGAFEWLWPRN